MKTTTRWKLVVIVEDDSDGRVLGSLAAKMKLPVTVDWLPANGIGNIKRNAGRLIGLAQSRVEPAAGCVAVVIDRDRKDPKVDEPHRTIAEECASSRVPLVVCREAMEAWFLADPGCCAWLGIKMPSRSDTITDPKARVSQAFLKKTRRSYQRRPARLQLAGQATGPDPSRNPSLLEAARLVANCLDP